MLYEFRHSDVGRNFTAEDRKQTIRRLHLLLGERLEGTSMEILQADALADMATDIFNMLGLQLEAISRDHG